MKLIGSARRQIRQAFWARFAPFGLTPQQGWMLRVLGAHGPLSLHGLAQWVFMDDPTACRIVKTLQDKGLVETEADPCHGRKRVIRASAEGLALVPRLDAVAEQLGAELEAGMTREQRLALRSGLLQAIANLDAAAPADPETLNS